MTKKAILERCREILKSTPTQATVSEPTHHSFLEAVLRHHPDVGRWPASQGGITRFTAARWAGEFHTPCLYVHYANGEVWDFSFHKCIRNMTREQVVALCRAHGLV